MTNKSLVTGGCGFVGWNLVDALIARGDEVTVADITEKAHRPDVKYVKVDITDPEAISAAIEGMDTVFHNASMVHTAVNMVDLVWKVNLGGTQNVIKACQEHGVKKLVYVSSGSVVYEGNDIENGTEDLPYSSVSQAPYADSKIQAEKEALAADGVKGVRVCAIRPHVIFGPGDGRFLPALLKKAYSGQLKFGVGRRNRFSDYTYISNLTDALLLADEGLEEGGKAGGEAYFVTNGEPMPFFDFIDMVLVRLGKPKVKWMVPGKIAYAVAAIAEGIDTLKGGSLNSEDGFTRFSVRYMCSHHYFSIEKAKRDLGYEPKVNLVEGLDKTMVWLRENGQLQEG